MANRDEVVRLALSLDPAGRAYVADILEASLRSEGFASAEIETAWAEEIERRLAAYDRGEITAIEGTGLDRLRQRLAERRTLR